MIDVAIIGSGFSGAFLGNLLAQAGFCTMLIDRRDATRLHIPETVNFSPDYLAEKLRTKSSVFGSCFSNKFSTSFFSSNSQESIYMEHTTDKKHGPFQMDRSALDKFLLERAIFLGCESVTGATIEGVEWSKQKQTIFFNKKNKSNSIDAKIIIDATGKDSLLSSMLDLRENKKILDSRTSVFSHFSGESIYHFFSKSTVSIVQIDEGFIFIVPLSRPFISVGVVSNRKILEESHELYFLRMIKKVAWLSEKLTSCQRCLGYLPVMNESFTVRNPCGDSFFIIGEALGFRDPFYSNGVLLALESAQTCFNAIKNIFSGQEKEETFQTYTEKIKALMCVSEKEWDRYFFNKGTYFTQKCIADPHIPYGITHFLTSILEDKSKSASEAMQKIRENFLTQKGAEYAFN